MAMKCRTVNRRSIGMQGVYELPLGAIAQAFQNAYERDGRTRDELMDNAEIIGSEIRASFSGKETIATSMGCILVLLDTLKDLLLKNEAA